MIDWLRKVRMVRRDVAPDPELIGELFRASAGKFKCPQCGAIGLTVEPLSDDKDDEAWGMGRSCEVCQRPIARERLSAVPDARLCVECQARADRGASDAPAEYCPRCGSAMIVRPTRGAGITRYTLVCPSCGH
jgi:predicted RNA-binding Zn-ribbon protein involved in translation (DUF1610 family)